jgi:hypothetical protein
MQKLLPAGSILGAPNLKHWKSFWKQKDMTEDITREFAAGLTAKMLTAV